MRHLLVFGVLGALVVVSVGGAATRPFPDSISWADAQHGWATNHGEWQCPPTRARSQGARVCSTEDGGRTWRTIFVGAKYVVALRTSRQAGIVSTGTQGQQQFWTRDNGRHWYGTRVVGGVGSPFDVRRSEFFGRGMQLYWMRSYGGTVNQVTPWPPTASATCSGRWAYSAFDEEDVDPRGNVCQGPPVEAGMRSTPVISGHGLGHHFALVPGGVLFLFRERDDSLTSVVRRGGVNLVRRLPTPDVPQEGSGGVRRLLIAWPSVTVMGIHFTGEKAKDSWEVIWRSPDGGASWRVETRRGWSIGSRNPIARSGTAAGVVGSEVIVAGGRFRDFRADSGSGAAGSRLVQAYRPADDTWRPLPDLSVAVSYAAGASSGRELYVVGGFDRTGTPQRGAFVFREGGWRRLPPAPEPRAAAGAAIVGGKLYVVGGRTRSGLARSVLVLDLRRNRWSTAPGPRPRAYLGVAALRGRIVALGGRTAGPATSVALVESWRPGDPGWQRLPALPSPRTDTAAVGLDDRVVAIGGAATEYYRPISSVAVLHLGAGRWQALPELRTPRYGVAAAVVGDRLYALVGGDSDGPNDKGTLNEWLSLGR